MTSFPYLPPLTSAHFHSVLTASPQTAPPLPTLLELHRAGMTSQGCDVTLPFTQIPYSHSTEGLYTNFRSDFEKKLQY